MRHLFSTPPVPAGPEAAVAQRHSTVARAKQLRQASVPVRGSLHPQGQGLVQPHSGQLSVELCGMNEEWLQAGVGGGLELALALAPCSLPLCSASRQGGYCRGPMPTPEAHPGPRALPEQQDMSWPACPWKEAAYQRGKDTLFRPGHLPGLGVPCSGPGRQSWPLHAGRSQ